MTKRESIKGKGVDVFFQDKETPKEKKVYMTIYLSSDTTYKIDALWLKMKQMTGKHTMRKSSFYDDAFKTIIKDFEENGDNSLIVKFYNGEYPQGKE